ncbi:MAG TPA: hypothetical protein VGX97_12510, partial [bacterium]|nr:hypothetical protein [bacterium]
AREPAGTLRGVNVTFGDHAAMILLRDRFVAEMRAQLAALPVTAADPVGADPSDHLVDAWYRNAEPVVTQFPDFPLATLRVSSPRGPVPFADAYSVYFRETVFEPEATADGEARYLAWRRQASREAIRFSLRTMTEATAKAQAIQTCDLAELLKLTGVGFGHTAARIAPLLMKVKGPGEQGYRDGNLSEPDFVARGYASNLDTLANAVQAQKELSSARYAVIVSAASLVLIAAPPLAGWALGTALGDAAASAAGAVSTYVAGFPLFTYESASQIYSTYQEHEDVRFALGAYAVIGVDRYFDAAERSTPWWQTGLSIFGNAVLQGASMTGQGHPTPSKGLSIWREERILARTEPPTLADIKAMPVAARDDVAALLLESRAEHDALRVHSEENLYLIKIWDALERETKALPLFPEDETPRLLQREELAPAEFGPTGTEVGKPDALRAAKNEIADAELLEDARAAAEADVAGLDTKDLAADPKAAPPLVESGVPKPTPQWPDVADPTFAVVPLPDQRWGRVRPVRLAVGGVQTENIFDLGGVISKDTAFFVVYHLKSADGLSQELQQQLVRSGVGLPSKDNPLVLKVLNPNAKGILQFARDYPGLETHVAERMLRAQERLDAIRFPHLKIVAAAGDAEIVIQRFLPDGAIRFRKGEFGADLPRTRIVLESIKKLVDNDLAWLDPNTGNYFFRVSGRSLELSILDMDMLGTVQDLRSGPYANFYNELVGEGRFRTFKSLGLSDAKALMFNTLLARQWIRWEKGLVDGIVPIREVVDVFPELKPLVRTAPVQAPKRGHRWGTGNAAAANVDLAALRRIRQIGAPLAQAA